MKTAKRVLYLAVMMLFTIVWISAQPHYRVVGYYPAWTRAILPAANLQMNILTHVHHAFAWPTVTGTIQADANVPDASLIAAVHSAGKKITIALGGWGHDAGFVPVATNLQVRGEFITNLITFITASGYDGVDLDWEFPANIAQRDSLTSLVRDIRAAFDEIDSSYLLTMAVPISNWSGQWIDFQKLLPYIDWFNAMAYDIHGSWTSHAGHNAPLYAPSTDYDGSAHQGIQYLNVTRGVPKNKLVLGVPFYGKRFAASAMYAVQTGVQDMTYADIAPAIQSSGWTYTWDNVSKVPFLTNISKTAVITFDDSTSLTIKCQYVKDNGLSGIMIWALGQDVVSGKQPLLEAIGSALDNMTDVHSVHDTESQDFILLNNAPNPFNPTTTISFQIPQVSSFRSVIVSLKVYDLLGRELVTLVNEKLPPGRYSVPWNASSFSNGVYLYRLTAGSFNQTKRMVLVK